MLARVALLCGLLASCAAASAPLPGPASPAPLPSAASAAAAASSPAAPDGSPAAEPVDSASSEPDEEPDAPAQTELVLADEQTRDVIVRFPSAACTSDEGTDLQIVITLNDEVHDTFTIATDNAPASCAEYGRHVERGDFNFDGHEDLAVPVDNAGSYGGPTYAILLFQPLNGHYVEAPQLSALTRENLGLFSVDPQRLRLMIFNKSGCCIHFKAELSVSGDVPNIVSSEVESILWKGDNCHVLLERTSGNGKTRISQRRCNKDEQP